MGKEDLANRGLDGGILVAIVIVQVTQTRVCGQQVDGGLFQSNHGHDFLNAGKVGIDIVGFRKGIRCGSGSHGA